MVKELRREKSVSQLGKFAFLIRGKISFFADVSIDYDGKRDTGRDESVLVETELLLGLWFICETLVDT